MFTIQPTPRKIGVRILGDYRDLHCLIDALEWHSHLLQQNDPAHSYAVDLLGTLLVGARSAIAGTDEIESVENGADEMGQLLVDTASPLAETVLRQRSRYQHGNLYYAFSITSIEAFALCRYLMSLPPNSLAMYEQNQSTPIDCVRDSILHQFICSLFLALSDAFGEERTRRLVFNNNAAVHELSTDPYEYLTYLNHAFLNRHLPLPDAENAVYGLGLLLCHEAKSTALAQCGGSAATIALLESVPDCDSFPSRYHELAARSPDGQVYMDEVFPDINRDITSW